MDQAKNLRAMFNKPTDINMNTGGFSSRVITVSSGKGGVGKTNFAVNLAINLVKQNKRVVVIDADFGLANIEVLVGIIPRYSLADVLAGTKKIEEVVTEGPNGIKFVSGGSGLGEIANITDRQMSYLLENLTYLDSIADVILIDTGAGISKSVINFIKASNESIIITTPEPTSVTDAYALIKTVKEQSINLPKFKIIVNRVDDDREANEIFIKLNKVCQKFLGVELIFLGAIPYDRNLVKSVKRQEPVTLAYPNTSSTRAIERINKQLWSTGVVKSKEQDGIKSFVKRLVNIFGN